MCYVLRLAKMAATKPLVLWVMQINCRNIVSTVDLGCKLDLKKIALHARNAEYNPKVLVSSCIICVCDFQVIHAGSCDIVT